MLYRAMLKRENAKKNGKKAFTLIELIVVIAIIGVLVAVLVPTMMGFVTQAQDQTRLANARSVYSAATAAVAQLQSQNQQVTQAAVEAALPALLGTQFTGNYTVTVTDGLISSVTFTDANGSATYPTAP